MLNKIKEKIRAKENSIDEKDLDMQLFLKDNNFIAHKIINYDDCCKYGFVFKYPVLAQLA